MMRFLVGFIRQVIKIAIVVGILIILATHAYVHTSIRVQGQRVAFNALVTWSFVIVAGCSILVADVFDNRRNQRDGQPPTETRQTLIDLWGSVRMLWRVKNIFYATLYGLLGVAMVPTFYAWITNPNNASAVNAFATGVLAVLTLLYVLLTGYLVRGNTRLLRAQSDANVVVYDTSPGGNGTGYPEIVVQNMGPVTARDVRLRVRLPDDHLSAHLGVLSTAQEPIRVGSLVPHQSAVLPLRSVPMDLLRREKPYTYTVTATWKGGSIADDASEPPSRTFSLAVRRDAIDRDPSFEVGSSTADPGMNTLIQSVRDGNQETTAQLAVALHDLAAAIRGERTGQNLDTMEKSVRGRHRAAQTIASAIFGWKKGP
jgi:hypothetical protein